MEAKDEKVCTHKDEKTGESLIIEKWDYLFYDLVCSACGYIVPEKKDMILRFINKRRG